MAAPWRAWYDDSSVYNSSQHIWADLPNDGLLVKMLYYADGTRQIQQGVDYYYEAPGRSGGTIQGCGMDEDEIETRYPGAIIVQGRWAPDDFYQKIVAKAFASEAPNGD